ncbi:L,D-transpeptidase family protein [Streptomyces sp. NPDC004065]|uniref:L,D-transpeptidase family protein n=1 Tax=Streptomyces sp. NPDC004065 TaxID=3364689 RepID=UPI00385024C7
MIARAVRAAALLTVPLLLSGCGGGTVAVPDSPPGTATDRAAGAAADRAAGAAADGTPAPDAERALGTAAGAGSPAAGAGGAADPGRIPGLGPRTRAAIPERSTQVLVVTGKDGHAPYSTAVLHERTGTGWRAGAHWPAHNALRGWTTHHTAGDLRSPIGVWGLSDAGGLKPDPGTRLPYHRSKAFTSPGTGFEGEPLTGSFDYVIAIDYNRRPGTSPLDWTRPLGAGRGGGIWLHVDHGGPTHGCVSLAEPHMRRLLATLDPDRHPVVVMGDAASLAR